MASRGTLDFNEVYARYADPVYRYCYRLCNRNAAQAEDLAQETFLTACSRLGQLKDPKKLRPWLYKIALRHYLHEKVQTNKTEPLAEATEATMEAPDLIEPTLEQMWLDRAMQQLPEPLRQAVLMVKVEGLTHLEASRIANVPLGTMLTRVHSGVNRLRKLLAEVPEASAAALLPGSLLDQHLRGWGDVKAPATLRPRVYGKLGLQAPGPSAGGATTSHPEGGNAARSSTVLAELLRRVPPSHAARWGLVAAGGVGIAAATSHWWRPTRKLSKPAATLHDTLQAMGRVRDAHITGHLEETVLGLDGSEQVRKSAVEFWFRSPDEFRRDLRYAKAESGTEYLVARGGGARMTVVTPHGAPRTVPMSEASVQALLAPVSYFARTGGLRAAEVDPATVSTLLDAELGNQNVTMLNVEQRYRGALQRWTLYVDPTTHRVVQSEFQSDAGRTSRDAGRRMSFTLDTFEYEPGVPESRFLEPHTPY